MNTRMFIIAAALIAAWSVSHSAPLKEQRFQLSIEKGPLASVLKQLSDQTGLQIGTEISVAKSRANTFGPVSGRATADKAMKKLLTGTDLWYAWRNEDTIRLFLISAQRTSWSSGVSTAKEASASIRGLAGVHYETGLCGELLVGPFSPSEPITAEAVWIELIKPHCPVEPRRSSDIEPGSIDRLTVAGHTEHNFSIPEMSRILALRRIMEQAGVVVEYVSSEIQEEQALVGPIWGQMSFNEALELAMQGSVLRARWVAEDVASVEPAYTMVTHANMSKCRCNFGLPELWPLQSERVTVVKPRLPPLRESLQAPDAVFDRAFIDATGASTIPELLNYLPQHAFSRSRGYRANAAQYFEGRGFGAQYALVLIDGKRAYGSAGDPLTNALDLNVVPLSAVERIDVALNQPSVLHGTDAIGGTVNIVLRKDLENRSATVSVRTARGGAEKKLATLSADVGRRGTKAGFVFDHQVRGDLLGSERDRWRNQDYRRYTGGLDYRSSFGVPPNVRLESALAHAAIVPEEERSSLYWFTNTALGSAELKFGGLLGRQAAHLQLFPVDVPGLTWGARHPQNPFDTDVIVQTLLTGLPPRSHEVESTLARVTTDLSGFVGGWEYSAFLGWQEDRSRAWLANEIDPTVLANSLTTENPAAALSVLGDRPGEGPLPPGLLLPPQINPYMTRAAQFGFNLSGTLAALPAGDVTADVGLAHREESVRFDAEVGRLDRDINSIFSQIRVPIVSGPSPSLLRRLELVIGSRRDFHNDVPDVTTWQSALSWQPLSTVKLHAGYSELFRPPSLYELYLPRFSLPFQIFDPKRNEAPEVMLLTGGNPSLHPTGGQSVDFGLSIQSKDGWKASLDYWETQMRNRVSVVLIQDLVNAQADNVAGRILRADQTPADIAANVPGRVLTLDITRANFGAIRARGFDFSFEHLIETSMGRITPRIDITRTVDFRYRDLPAASRPMLNRAGVASVYGTVPTGRAVASLMLEIGGFHASAFARYHTSYRDYSIVSSVETDRRIPSQTLFDIKLTKHIGNHLTLSVGANNALDDRPPFAQSGGWEGFDQSQGDLVGREVFLDVTGSF